MKNGFTLVETLVALFVFGLLAAAAVVVLGNSADAQLRLSAISGEVQDMQRVRAALRADLAQTANRLSRDENGASLPAFASAGEEGRLFALVRRGWENPDGKPRASLQYVEYRLDDGGLVRRTREMIDGAAFGEPAVLAQGITAIAVSYREGDDWNDIWSPSDPATVPSALQIDFTTDRFGILRHLFLTGTAV